MYNVVLRDINLNGSDVSNASLVNVDARRARLENVNFRNVDLGNANFSKSILKNANLNGAILLSTKLNGADLTDVILDNAIVDRQDWLIYIKDNLKLKGAKELFEKYKVDSLYSKVFDAKVLTVLKK